MHKLKKNIFGVLLDIRKLNEMNYQAKVEILNMLDYIAQHFAKKPAQRPVQPRAQPSSPPRLQPTQPRPQQNFQPRPQSRQQDEYLPIQEQTPKPERPKKWNF